MFPAQFVILMASMPSIRKLTTASGATAIQVVRYHERKVVLLKHVGSARSTEEIAALVQSAQQWIERFTGQTTLLPRASERVLHLATCRYIGVLHTFAYTILSAVAHHCGLAAIPQPLLIDLALMRIVEPASKRRSVQLLKQYFNISYALRTVYRILPTMTAHKSRVEQIAVECARRELAWKPTLVLYDVTTLYFESFEADDLRRPGFSKDHKANQPQIVLGLLVTEQGFPLGYEVFRGNTFEGHTMLPVLMAFAKRHEVETCTVVADAAMISSANVAALQRQKLTYIVGARLANCSPVMIERIAKELERHDDATIRLATVHGDLVCSFSTRRYRKDKAELDKQVLKAKQLVEQGEPGKRAKFIKTKQTNGYAFNDPLLEKATLLLGIKGYYTNIPLSQQSDAQIIAHYHNLWHVEQAFRMTKSDLLTRPIFHYAEEAVKAHLLICFVALIMGKYMEMKTGVSLRRMMDLLWEVTDARIIDTVTNEVFTLRCEIGEEIKGILKKLKLSY